MSSKKKKKKAKGVPKTALQSHGSGKQVPDSYLLSESSVHQSPVWHLSQLDLDGPFGWSNIPPSVLRELPQKLAKFESRTFQEILGPEHHEVKLDSLSNAARKRLGELKKDDEYRLLSLKIDKLKRVWGIRRGAIVNLLWWDPDHQVCLSNATGNSNKH